MWNLFRKNKQRKDEKKLPSKFNTKRESKDIQEGFYANGKFSVKVSCEPQYCIGIESLERGCGAVYVITEDDITSGASMYRSNALFGWRCKYCNSYHVLRTWIIPENVKDKVFYRDNPEKRAKIIDFESYKKAKGKN